MIKYRKLILLFVFFIASTLYSQTLHLYGGANSDEYLGCLNCDPYDKNSIWNEYGHFGSKFRSESIWNDYGSYGGPNSSYSPWNVYASSPPAIVDQDGNFYGYLTIDTNNYKRSDLKLALLLCEYHDLIKNDVSGWYGKLFR